MEHPQRATAPVAKVDFVNSIPPGTNVETASPQPANHAMVAEGAVSLGGATVEAGHHVLVNLSAANLDPAEFDDPLTVA